MKQSRQHSITFSIHSSFVQITPRLVIFSTLTSVFSIATKRSLVFDILLIGHMLYFARGRNVSISTLDLPKLVQAGMTRREFSGSWILKLSGWLQILAILPKGSCIGKITVTRFIERLLSFAVPILNVNKEIIPLVFGQIKKILTKPQCNYFRFPLPLLHYHA